MVVKTYFDKTNTILKDNLINTGKNPVSELYYGITDSGYQTHSRLLLHFDLTRLTQLQSNTALGDDVKHVIKMTNTGVFDNDLLNTKTGDGKKRTSSFELVLFELPKGFDEGVGYDYYDVPNATVSNMGSNWKYAKTNDEWDMSGAIINDSNFIASQSFDAGNENLEMDVTAYVNDCIAGVKENHGLCLAFRSDLENLETEELQYVGFFTQQTQTFFEPHLESRSNVFIKDDRYNFIIDKPNKLYLYIKIGGNYVDLDELPEAMFNSIQYPVSHERTGIYSITLTLTDQYFNSDTILQDMWSNIKIDGQELDDVNMSFHLKSADGYINIGEAPAQFPTQYKSVIVGMKTNETIVRGDIRKVFVNPIKLYTVNEYAPLDKIEYRISVKQGNDKVVVIDYTQLDNSGFNNYFLLDTLSLLPNKYYLDIKYYVDMEARIENDVITFKITN